MASPDLHIGFIQFDTHWENPNANMGHIERLMQHQETPQLLLLPEMWSSGFSMRPETVAETSPGPALEWMLRQSQHWNTAIAGSLSVKDGAQFYNRFYCTFPDGSIIHYDKKHLFTYGKENEHYTPGTSNQVFEIKGWRIKPIICYDLRFPVWCRNTDAYDLMVVVANWPLPRIHHWDALLKARAIENQSYVAAVNRIGTDGNGLSYNGQSIVYDMNGQSLLSMNEKEGVGSCLLPKDALIQFRNQFRFLQDRDTFRL